MSTTHGEGFFFLGFVPSRTEFPLPATGVNRWALDGAGEDSFITPHGGQSVPWHPKHQQNKCGVSRNPSL